MAAAAAWAAGPVLLLAAAATPAGAGVNVWTQIGPNGGNVDALATDPADPRILYAGSVGGVFKSTNGGASWRLASRGLKTIAINALAVDPQQRGMVVAAVGGQTTLKSGLWASRDGGATWSPGPSSDNGYVRDGGEEFFTSVAIDPVHPGWAFGASNFAIYVSHDAGRSWGIAKDFTKINFFHGLATQVAADPARGSVFAHAAGNYFFGNAPYVKLFETTDGGGTWVDRSDGLPVTHSEEPGFPRPLLAIEPTAPGILYLLQEGKIFRSRDGTQSWVEARAGSPPLAAGPHGLAIAGDAAKGIIQSTDGGKTWAKIASPPVDYVTAFAFGAARGQLYAAGNALGVLASDDGGQSWRTANAGLAATRALAVAVDPASSARIYAAVGDVAGPLRASGLWKTASGGAHWHAIAGELPFAAVGGASLFFDPNNSRSVLFTGNVAARSADAGASWTELDLPDCLDARSLVQDPSSAAVLYAAGRPCATQVCNLSKSLDGGASWRCLGLAVEPSVILVAASDPAVVYAVTGDRSAGGHLIWRSDDAGTSWAPIDIGLPLSSLSFYDRPTLAVDPTNAQRLFAGFPKSVWRSLDGGAHWTERDRGLPLATAADFLDAYPPLLAVDPNNPSLVYAGANYLGVYRSLNGGYRWQPILAGLPPLETFSAGVYVSMMPDPTTSGILYLATWGRGLLAYSAE